MMFSRPMSKDELPLVLAPPLDVKALPRFIHCDQTYETAIEHLMMGTCVRFCHWTSSRAEQGLLPLANEAYRLNTVDCGRDVAAMLLNVDNVVCSGDGRPTAHRKCDIWWFSRDRHSLYAVAHNLPSYSRGRRGPRDGENYAGCPVAIVQYAFPLLPAYFQDLLPLPLYEEVIELRKKPRISPQELDLLQFITVPPKISDIPDDLFEDSPEWTNILDREKDPGFYGSLCQCPPCSFASKDLDCSEDSSEDSSEDRSEDSSEDSPDRCTCQDCMDAECCHFLNVEAVPGEPHTSTWRWTFPLGAREPYLLRRPYHGEPTMLEVTPVLRALVRAKDLGISDGPDLLRHCLDAVLDCCPTEWRDKITTGALISPLAGRVLLPVRYWRALLRAIPVSLRSVLGLLRPTGNIPCSWAARPTRSGRCHYWNGCRMEPERRFRAKNTRFCRGVRDALGVPLEELTWADLINYQIYGAPAVKEKPGEDRGLDLADPASSQTTAPASQETPVAPAAIQVPPRENRF